MNLIEFKLIRLKWIKKQKLFNKNYWGKSNLLNICLFILIKFILINKKLHFTFWALLKCYLSTKGLKNSLKSNGINRN